MHLKFTFEFEIALFHKNTFLSFFVISLIKTIWQVIKKRKNKRVNELDSVLCFSIVNITSI